MVAVNGWDVYCLQKQKQHFACGPLPLQPAKLQRALQSYGGGPAEWGRGRGRGEAEDDIFLCLQKHLRVPPSAFVLSVTFECGHMLSPTIVIFVCFVAFRM